MDDVTRPPSPDIAASDTLNTPTRVLLLSGGLDSAALAAWLQPEYTLFIDYGQRPREAEARAAAAVAAQLNLHHATLHIDLRPIGGGLLTNDQPHEGWPSPEWWPYRNQLLVTIAAGWAVRNIPHSTDGAVVQLVAGTVASDRHRHADGQPAFYDKLNDLLGFQEGNNSVTTPAITLTTEELIRHSRAPDDVLGWTHSCHRSDLPCLDCPGCHKREQVLADLDRLQ